MNRKDVKMDSTKEYLSVVAMEECGEIIQAISKFMRFGKSNHHPNTPDITNEQQLMIEFHQLEAVIELMEKYGYLDDFSEEEVEEIKKNKIKKVSKYRRRYFSRK